MASASTLLRAGLVGAAAVGMAQVGPAATWLPPVRRGRLPRLDGAGSTRSVALTFDDGPDPESTPAFLEVLDDLGVKATFFLLGQMVERAPALTAEMAAAGHEIALHGWHHHNSLRVTPWSLADSMSRAKDLVEATTGQPLRYYRPPYGVVAAGNLYAARKLGLTTVLWGAWGKDWAPTATPARVLADLRPDLRPGTTVLLHDSDCTSSPGSWRSTLGRSGRSSMRSVPPAWPSCRWGSTGCRPDRPLRRTGLVRNAVPLRNAGRAGATRAAPKLGHAGRARARGRRAPG